MTTTTIGIDSKSIIDYSWEQIEEDFAVLNRFRVHCGYKPADPMMILLLKCILVSAHGTEADWRIERWRDANYMVIWAVIDVVFILWDWVMVVSRKIRFGISDYIRSKFSTNLMDKWNKRCSRWIVYFRTMLLLVTTDFTSVCESSVKRFGFFLVLKKTYSTLKESNPDTITMVMPTNCAFTICVPYHNPYEE